MDLATFDLQNYQLARQLHMLTALYDVFLSNNMSYPLFYESLHPEAKRHARVTLLVLNRLFAMRGGAGATLFMQSPYRIHTLRLVLSFFIYADSHFEWTSCVSRQVGAPGNRGDATHTPLRTPATNAAPPSLETTPLRLGASMAEQQQQEQLQSQQHTTEGSQPPPSSAAEGSPSGSLQESPQVPQHLRTALAAVVATAPAATSAAAPVNDVMARALFYVRPVNASHMDRSSPQFGTTAHIYVRMIHTHLLNEESLNPYFGRYGQVDCAAIQRVPLSQYAPYLGAAATEALLQLFATSTNAASHDASSGLYVQDFIISLDSHQNAVHAVRRAYYKELVCVALHDPTTTHNTHCLADVNAWMRRHAFVWRLRAEVSSSGAAKAEATTAEAAAAAAAQRRRKRSRAKHRMRERRRKRRAVLGDDGDERISSAPSSSSPSESGKGDHEGSSTGSSSASSSTSSSGSSSDGSSSSDAEDDLAQFVPDVLLDGFPYWTTEDQLKVLLQEYGTVAELRLSIDDLSGAFTGSVLVRMSTLEEAITISHALHDMLYRGYRLISGVINERLEVVALEDGTQVRVAPANAEQIPYDVTLNERVWV